MAAWNAAVAPAPERLRLRPVRQPSRPGPRRRRLTVGYVGAVDDWFDMELLDAAGGAAAAMALRDRGRPRGRRVPVGPRLPNVRLPRRAAPRARCRLPAQRFDVEIIPFRLSALTHATDPVKLYEAAAAGRPLVATPLQSLQPFARRGLVRLAATPEDFAREIEAAASAGAGPAPRASGPSPARTPGTSAPPPSRPGSPRSRAPSRNADGARRRA